MADSRNSEMVVDATLMKELCKRVTVQADNYALFCRLERKLSDDEFKVFASWYGLASNMGESHFKRQMQGFYHLYLGWYGAEEEAEKNLLLALESFTQDLYRCSNLIENNSEFYIEVCQHLLNQLKARRPLSLTGMMSDHPISRYRAAQRLPDSLEKVIEIANIALRFFPAKDYLKKFRAKSPAHAQMVLDALKHCREPSTMNALSPSVVNQHVRGLENKPLCDVYFSGKLVEAGLVRNCYNVLCFIKYLMILPLTLEERRAEEDFIKGMLRHNFTMLRELAEYTKSEGSYFDGTLWQWYLFSPLDECMYLYLHYPKGHDYRQYYYQEKNNIANPHYAKWMFDMGLQPEDYRKYETKHSKGNYSNFRLLVGNYSLLSSAALLPVLTTFFSPALAPIMTDFTRAYEEKEASDATRQIFVTTEMLNNLWAWMNVYPECQQFFASLLDWKYRIENDAQYILLQLCNLEFPPSIAAEGLAIREQFIADYPDVFARVGIVKRAALPGPAIAPAAPRR